MAKILEPIVGRRSHRVAYTILQKFGSLSSALHASEERLRAALNEGDRDAACLIGAARALVEASLSENLSGTIVDPVDQRLHRYLQYCFNAKLDEQLRAIFADSRGGYLRDELLASGGSTHVALQMRRLFGRAHDLGASAFILAHNHPSGCCFPSKEDLEDNDKLRAIGAALDLTLLDHLIVTRSEIFSMKQGRVIG